VNEPPVLLWDAEPTDFTAGCETGPRFVAPLFAHSSANVHGSVPSHSLVVIIRI